MAELETGDIVFDDRGQPCTVTAVTDVMFGHHCYRVVFSDGSTIVADAEHNWLTWDKPARKALTDSRRHSQPRVVTTMEMAETLWYGEELNHAVRVAEPLQYDEAKLLIDPYVLGVWLGDGHSAMGRITCFDQGILDEIEQRGYVVSPNAYRGNYGILGLHVQLKEAGLLNNKYIPSEYFRASVSQRKDLLHGIMDTDGGVNPNGQCDLTMMSREIIDGVEELALGLGCKVVRSTRRAKLYERDCGLAHRLNITATFPVFKLSRKVAQQFAKAFSPSRGIRTVRAVESVETVPVRCIQVDSPSHMYLAGRACIPTHNSTMAARDRELTLLLPGTRGWICAPTYDLGEKEFRVIWNDFIIGKRMGLDKRVKKAYSVKQGNMYIEFPWQSRVEVRSADHPETLVGEGLDWIILSEAAKHRKETWEKYLRPALSDRHGGADFPTTPEGQNWLHKLWQLGQNPDYPDWESWQFPSWNNPVVFPGGRQDPEIKLVEATTTLEWFLQEYGAEFTAFVGKIYSEWDEKTHVKRLTFDPKLPNYMGFDWGFSNSFAAIEFQVTPQDEVRIWREHYASGYTLEDHVRMLKNRANPDGYHLDCGFGDAADPDAAVYMSRHLVGTWAEPDAKKNWRMGVDRVKWFLQERETGVTKDEFGTPELAPKLFVDHSCKHVIHEFNNYRAAPEPKTGADPQDKPFKRDDHAMDAIRYALVHLYDLGAGRHLDELYDANRTSVGEGEYTNYPTIDQEASVYMGGETIFDFSKEMVF
jgi:hypothetical protein